MTICSKFKKLIFGKYSQNAFVGYTMKEVTDWNDHLISVSGDKLVVKILLPEGLGNKHLVDYLVNREWKSCH